MNADRCASDADGLAEKGSLSLIGLDQIEGHAGSDGKDQARKAGARAKVDRVAGEWAHQGQELEGISDVPVPQNRLVRRCDEVDCAVPADQEVGEGFNRRARFT